VTAACWPAACCCTCCAACCVPCSAWSDPDSSRERPAESQLPDGAPSASQAASFPNAALHSGGRAGARMLDKQALKQLKLHKHSTSAHWDSAACNMRQRKPCQPILPELHRTSPARPYLSRQSICWLCSLSRRPELACSSSSAAAIVGTLRSSGSTELQQVTALPQQETPLRWTALHQKQPCYQQPPSPPSMPSDGCMSTASGCTLRTVGAWPVPRLPVLPADASETPASVPSDGAGRMRNGSACLAGRLLPANMAGPITS